MGCLLDAHERNREWYLQLVSERFFSPGRTEGGTKLTGVCSQLLNEIMPMIYRRFTEKTAEEWRQIYKVHIFAG